MSWTDERVAILKKLWGEGKTAAEIASELGGVTRNAVIGKAHRLKLSNRVSPIQQNKKPKAAAPPPAPSPRKARKAMVDEAMKKGKGLSLDELTGSQCRWPSGDPQHDDFGFCGHRSVPGLPYCEDHARVAYQAASKSRVLKAEDFEDKRKTTDGEDDSQKIAVAQ